VLVNVLVGLDETVADLLLLALAVRILSVGGSSFILGKAQEISCWESASHCRFQNASLCWLNPKKQTCRGCATDGCLFISGIHAHKEKGGT